MTGEARLKNAYVKGGGKKVAVLPWADIIAMLLQLFEGCDIKEAKAFAKAHPLATEFLVRRRLGGYSDLSVADRNIVAKAAVAAFNAATIAEIQAA